VARPRRVRRARRATAQGPAGLRRPPRDGGGRRDRMVVRSVHLDGGRAPPAHHWATTFRAPGPSARAAARWTSVL